MMDAWQFFAYMKTDAFASVVLFAPASFKSWFYQWWDAGWPAPSQDRYLWSRRPLLPQEKSKPTCGAHCKSTGEPCKIRVVYRGGRCRLHGGWSCGPYRTRRGRYHPLRLS